MDKKRILTPAVVTFVALIHAGLAVLLWHAHKPPPVEMANTKFVDLGDLGGGDGSPEGEGAPAAPEPTPEQPEPKPKSKPKPVGLPKPVVKPVITKKEKADVVQQKERSRPIEKPKPESRPESKSEPRPESKSEPKPEPKAEPKPSPKASEHSGSKTGPNIAEDGKGSGEGKALNGEGKGDGGGMKGIGSGHGEGSGLGSGGSKGEHGSGTGGGGGGSGIGTGNSKDSPAKGTYHIPRPSYPIMPTENGEEGLVVLKVLAGPSGKVDSTSVNKSSGYSRLDNTACKAVKDGSCHASVQTESKIPVKFTLEQVSRLKLIDQKIYAVGRWF